MLLLRQPNIFAKFLYDKNYFVIANNDQIIDDNNGMGYTNAKHKLEKRIRELTKQETEKYQQELNRLNRLLNSWFNLNRHFYVLCQQEEYNYKMQNKVFDLNVFNNLLANARVTTLPVDSKYLFKYFKYGEFVVKDNSTSTKKKSKHYSANYYFNQFVKQFNKNAKVRQAIIDRNKSI